MPEITENSTISPTVPSQENSREEIQAVIGEPRRIKFIENIVVGLVVVLFIGFAGLFAATSAILIDAWNNKTATYQDLVKQVDAQSTSINKIDTETQDTQTDLGKIKLRFGIK